MAFKANIKPGAFKMHMAGKSVKFANFTPTLQKDVMKRLGEKDNVMEKGRTGILPGIKIDGREVTRDNLHEFKTKEKPKKEKSVIVKTHKKDVKPGPGKLVKKIQSYKRRKPKK